MSLDLLLAPVQQALHHSYPESENDQLAEWVPSAHDLLFPGTKSAVVLSHSFIFRSALPQP